MSSKRPRTEKYEKSKKPESSKSKPISEFVSQNVRFKHSIINKKHIISDCSVVLADFEHLNPSNILRTSSMEYFVAIKEQIYPELDQFFYSNLSFHDNII